MLFVFRDGLLGKTVLMTLEPGEPGDLVSLPLIAGNDFIDVGKLKAQ